MKTKILSLFMTICMVASLISAVPITANAETYGELTYSVNTDSTITITGCAESAVSIKIPGKIDGKSVTKIADNAFKEHEKLKSVIIPGSVTSVGYMAFYNCSALTSVTIGSGVTSIGSSAFSNCTALTSVTIGSGVTTIISYAFYNCTSLKDVYITDIAAWCNIKFYDTSSNPLYYASNLYINGELTTDIVIPDGVEKIKDYAFYGFDGLKSVTIPDSVTSIGSYAFRNCTALTSVTIGNGVTTIVGSYAFSGCTSLKDVYITDIAAWCNIDFEYSYDFYSNPLYYASNLYINGELTTDIVIPDGVEKIKDCAFYGFDGLKSVTIPDSVTSIGTYAFYSCQALTSVTIPDSVTSIGSRAFSYCQALTSVTIPDSVTSIGGSAFYNCTALTSVTIGNSVTSIGSYAFYDCRALTSVIIPDSVTSIGDSAFGSCDKLTSVTLGESVESIASYAFSYCSALKTIVIPKSLTKIEAGTFSNCNNITTVNYTGTEEEWDEMYIGSSNGSLLSASVKYEYMLPLSVTYNANGGSNAPEAQKTKENSEVIIPSGTPVRAGYIFLGWATDSSATTPQYQPNDTLTVGSEDITLYAVWESLINIKYNLNGGDSNLPKSQKSDKNSEVVISSETPVRAGYIFLGWSTDSYAKEAQYQPNDTLAVGTEDITLYAIWERLINIKYSLNGGGISLPQPQQAESNSEIAISSTTPEREEYIFLGWATDSSAKVAQYQPNDTLTVGSEDITLYAVWKKIVTVDAEILNDIFMITPNGAPEGCDIIFACYNQGLPVYIDIFEYQGSKIIPFTTTAEYDQVKVMIWDGLDTMYSLCDAKEVVTSEPINLLMIE